MILNINIYRDKRFDERIEALRREGGKSLAVAKRADRLIKRLSKGRNGFPEVGKQTNYGEMRIKHCRKYDLGNGYRLISLQEGNQIILLYIGTHDECSRWLERNKGLRYKIDYLKGTIMETEEDKDVAHTNSEEKDPVEEYEKQLMERIDDNILRKIFWGLCK